jgi:hypothetical protein
MKPTSTLDIIFAVIELIKLTLDFVNKKGKKDEIKKPVYRNDDTNVLDEFLGRK